MVAADIRRKKRELKEVLDKLAQQNLSVKDELKQCAEIAIPNRRKDKRVQQPGSFNFKTNEHEARQDLAIID